MNFVKTKKLSQGLYIIFNFLVLLTLFLPSISLDKYVEYEFNGYYNSDYTSYTTPIATRITPVDLISSVFSDYNELNIAEKNYAENKAKLTAKKDAGELTENSYNKKLASSKATNTYYPKAIYYGDIKELSRFQSKMFLYTMLLLVFYVVVAINLVINIINYFEQRKTLYIANIFGGFISFGLLLVFAILTFSMALFSTTNIKGINGGNIMQQTTICFSPKAIVFVIITLFLAYAIYALKLDKLDNKYNIQIKEIPTSMNDNINKKINYNKYRKINSKKSKYKHGSKKERRR